MYSVEYTSNIFRNSEEPHTRGKEKRNIAQESEWEKRRKRIESWTCDNKQEKRKRHTAATTAAATVRAVRNAGKNCILYRVHIARRE